MVHYILLTKAAPIENSRCKWYESLPDKKVVFPTDITQVPDIIIYFADEDTDLRRHSYVRLKASDVLCSDKASYDLNEKPRVFKLQEDRALDLVSDDEFPGTYLF